MLNIRLNWLVLGWVISISAVCDASRSSSVEPGTLLKALGVSDIASLEREIMVPMRDGIRLSTSILKPSIIESDKKYPVILVRTPYAIAMELGAMPDSPQSMRRLIRGFLENDYIIVVQNERGTQWSEGEFHFLPEARNDGADVLDWIVAQPWSNGSVGTLGCSSSAENQMPLAAENHPAHKAMIAMSSAAGVGSFGGFPSRGLFYRGGVPYIGVWAGWYAFAGAQYRPKLPANITREERVRLVDTVSLGSTLQPSAIQSALDTLPSARIMSAARAPSTDFDRFIRLSPSDSEWNKVNHLQAGDHPKVPALHIGSWYDLSAYETVKTFEHFSSVPNQFLIMGSTEHCQLLTSAKHTKAGVRDVGDGRLYHKDGAYEQLFIDWFDYWLKGKDNSILDIPKVQVTVMGNDEWIEANHWPPENTNTFRYYLNSESSANSRMGDGMLVYKEPISRDSYDQFVSDPAKPVISKGGFGCCAKNAGGAQDQSEVEVRDDVLVYTSKPFEKSIQVVGEIKLILFVSTDVKDTDLAIKIVDVYPTGEAFNLSDTILRLRYRDGYEDPGLLEPGKIYKIAIEGLVTSNYFGVGHRIRLQVAGSNFPQFERNMNTGGGKFR